MIGFDGPLLIREVEAKNVKHIHIMRVGEREEYQLKFEVHEFIIITLIDHAAPNCNESQLENEIILQGLVDHMVWLKLLRETSQDFSSTLPDSGILRSHNANFISPRRHHVLKLQQGASLPDSL